MKSINLEFKGPFHNDRFCDDCQTFPEDSDLPGVYIWGFKTKTNDRFIPYYVGKRQTSIAERIRDHLKDIRENKDSTKMRFTKAYMEGDGIKPFYKEDEFHLITSNWSKNKLPSWFTDRKEYYLERIEYLNNRGFFELKSIPINKKLSRGDYPYSNIIGGYNYLWRHVEDIWVMYASYDHSHIYIDNNDIKDVHEIIEAFTKFHLKGITVSKSLSLNTMNNKMNKLNIEDITIVNIKSHKDVFKEEPSELFPGY
jgi:hypothetical protein